MPVIILDDNIGVVQVFFQDSGAVLVPFSYSHAKLINNRVFRIKNENHSIIFALLFRSMVLNSIPTYNEHICQLNSPKSN